MAIRRTYKILSCLELSELAGLSESNLEVFKMILSAGFVEIKEGNWIKQKLWNIFPEGTTTGDNLRDPVKGIVDTPYEPPEE